jgi:PAS domain S-box-containing protein
LSINSITEIDPLFRRGFHQFLQTPRTIQVGKIERNIKIFSVQLNGKKGGFLYLFEVAKILKILDFETFLDYINLGIAIINRDGIVENLNSTLSGLIGRDIKKWVGHNMNEVVDAKLQTESASLRTLEEKKTTMMDVTYSSGTILRYRNVPVLDENGNVLKIIGSALDVTRIKQLEEDLASSEKLKDNYYKKMNTLEMLCGGDRIVYSSEQMRRAIEVAVKASNVDSPVFLWGETGVGKEMIARLIHQIGTRKKDPFVGINCSAISSELVESEFFGYEEGAFTGSKKGGKRGLFHEAEGGCLFLDEVTELSFGLQSKLLRVLQEHEYLPVGSSKPIPTNVRLISATNLSAEQILDGTSFRRDLFYRLNVIPIHIPPLRERRDDILPLIRFFQKELNLKYNTTTVRNRII